MSESSARAVPVSPFAKFLRRWWPLLLLLGAFLLGLSVFAMLMLRNDAPNEFFRTEQTEQTSAGAVLQPLPVPQAVPQPAPNAAGPSVTEAVLPPPVPAQTEVVAESIRQPDALPETMSDADGAGQAAAAAAHNRNVMAQSPRPIHSPQPNYPSQALRRREQGVVRLRVDVDANGRVVNIAVTQSSGSRHLDRAAREAMRRWQFEPAIRNGQAVMGTVDVPFEFTLQ